jgi:hypothetical protein
VAERPRSTKRFSLAECSGSVTVKDSGSPKAVTASSKLTPCFRSLLAALTGSQEKPRGIRGI